MKNFLKKMLFFNNLILTIVLCSAAPILAVAKNADSSSSQSTVSYKLIPGYQTTQYDQNITNIYQRVLNHPHSQNVAARMVAASAYFLGKPYLLGPLGEGPTGTFDQGPLYRTDAFDCMTFVETSLALARANNLSEFKTLINHIRYANGDVNYFQRNHFTSIDWNPNNQQQNFIHDITQNLGLPVRTAVTLIDQPNWYRFADSQRLEMLSPISSVQAGDLLTTLHAHASLIKPEWSKIDYVPLSELFTSQQGKIVVNQAVFAAIPDGAIIEMVNPTRNLRSIIGTQLNVEHMGIAVHTRQGLMLREASSYAHQVVDTPLFAYLAYYYLHAADSSRLGIHVEAIEQ